MGKLRLYYFSPEKLDFVDARGAKTKIAALTLVVCAIVVALLFEFNQYFDDVLGLGINRTTALYSENAMLKKQIRTVTARLEGLEKQLTSLNERGNELRLLVDLPRIDDDTRKVGIGGTDERLYYSGSMDVDEQLRQVNSLLGRAERELQLQHSSYSEVTRKYEDNRVRFAHLPAIKPMEGFLSSGFGLRWHPIFGVRRSHEGIDIVNDRGTPIYAAANGLVEVAGRNLGGYGNMVMVDHGYGYTTVYGHLSKVVAREGQQVKRGDLIGLCGETGIATNSHLHYEVRLNGVQQNPRDYFFDDFNYVESIRNESTGGKQD